MESVLLDGAEIECEVRGTGEPVLLVHGSHLADAFLPLLEEPALGDGYKLVRYHRRGFAGTGAPEQVSIAEQAADARRLLRHLGIERAHVIGYDLGGVIALQLALDAPAAVHSLALLEPILLMVDSGEAAVGGVLPSLELYLSGDRAGSVHAFLEMIAGPDSPAVIESRLPGALDQAAKDVDTFFRAEMLPLRVWTLSEQEAGRITQPVLSVVAEHSAPFFKEGRELLHQWFHRTEDFDLFNAGHLLQIENPEAMAGGLAWFLGRHPL